MALARAMRLEAREAPSIVKRRQVEGARATKASAAKDNPGNHAIHDRAPSKAGSGMHGACGHASRLSAVPVPTKRRRTHMKRTQRIVRAQPRARRAPFVTGALTAALAAAALVPLSGHA